MGSVFRPKPPAPPPVAPTPTAPEVSQATATAMDGWLWCKKD